jgi:uncharacterized membrane protein
MLPLIIGLAIFFAAHLVPTQPELRRGLIERHGETAYRVGFGVVALVGLVLIVLGYGKLQLHPGKNVQLWDPPLFMRHITLALMLPAMILLVAAYVPSRIRSAVKHPMLAAIKTWAFAHLLANGDLGSVLLFGSFLAFAVFDRISAKKRQAPGPLGARTGGVANDVIVVLAGLGLYAFMLTWGHQHLIGVRVLP